MGSLRDTFRALHLEKQQIAVCQPQNQCLIWLSILLLSFPKCFGAACLWTVITSNTDTETWRKNRQWLKTRHAWSQMSKPKTHSPVLSLANLDFVHRPGSRPVHHITYSTSKSQPEKLKRYPFWLLGSYLLVTFYVNDRREREFCTKVACKPNSDKESLLQSNSLENEPIAYLTSSNSSL